MEKMLKRVKLEIEMEIKDYEDFGLDADDVLKSLTLISSDIYDGYMLTTSHQELDITSDFVIGEAKITNRKFLEI